MTVAPSSTSALKAHKKEQVISLPIRKLAMIENLLFDGLGQELIHLRMALDQQDFLAECAKVFSHGVNIAKP